MWHTFGEGNTGARQKKNTTAVGNASFCRCGIQFQAFSVSMWKLGISTEEEFLSETSMGLLSSSKPKFRDLYQEIWLGETSGKSNPSLTPSWKNPKY